MKRIIGVLLAMAFLAGCGGMQLNDDAVGNSIGYFSGKGMGIAINQAAPLSVPAIEKNYDEFMLRNAGLEFVPPEETISLFNSTVLALTFEIADPYGLISDLSFLMTQFGGQMLEIPGGSPIVTGLQPIPLVIFKTFEMGYDSGKRISDQM
jgi:hypothetical protein